MSREQLTNNIWSVCDILRRDNNCGGIMEYVEHLSWVLFLKFLDEQEDNFEQKSKVFGHQYQRIIEGEYRWSNWVTKGLGKKKENNSRRSVPEWDAERLIEFVRENLIPYLASLSGSPEREVIAGIFGERNVILCDSVYNLKDVLEIVDRIDFSNPDDIHTVSHTYENLLKRLGSENKMAGEFYTPRPVIRFMVEVIEPKTGETVYDPACGTCGFLVEAYKYMKAKEKTTKDRENLQRKTFFGQEKKPIPAFLGTMNMVLHGVSVPQIRRKNSLEENIREVSEKFDIVLTNPPFGGTENIQIQGNFPIQSNATELLFVEHIIKKLRPIKTARCAMVVPEGTLFRSGAFGTVKEWLLNEFNLVMVVSLPPGTFAPYSDVKAALLFFEKGKQGDEVLYQEIALPEELKKFSKGNPIDEVHFSQAQEIWQQMKAYRQGKGKKPEVTDFSWFEKTEDLIKRGFDLSAKNPTSAQREKLPEPSVILDKIIKNQEMLYQNLLSLKQKLDEGVDLL